MKDVKKKDKKLMRNNIEFFVYILQYILLGLGILILIGNIVLLVFSLFYSLSEFIKSSIIGIILSASVIYTAYSRFKEVRKKYSKNKKNKEK